MILPRLELELTPLQRAMVDAFYQSHGFGNFGMIAYQPMASEDGLDPVLKVVVLTSEEGEKVAKLIQSFRKGNS